MSQRTADLRIESFRPLLAAGHPPRGAAARRQGSETVSAWPRGRRAPSSTARTTGSSSSSARARSTIPSPRSTTRAGCAALADEHRARPLHRHARLLREAAHHRRLEGAHQRSAPRRHLRHQRGAAAGAPPAARSRRAGAAGRLRVPRPDLAAVHRRPRVVGRDRRAHDREPGPSRARLRPVDAGRLQERHRRRRADRHRRRARGAPTRTASSASPSRASAPSSPRAATPTATSSCAAGRAARTTTPSSVQKTATRAARRGRGAAR